MVALTSRAVWHEEPAAWPWALLAPRAPEQEELTTWEEARLADLLIKITAMFGKEIRQI